MDIKSHVKKYFQKPLMDKPLLSHDGLQVCYLANEQDFAQLEIMDLKSKQRKILLSGISDNIYILCWSLDNKKILYSKDCDGNENYRLYGIDLKTNEQKCYTPFDQIIVGDLDLCQSNINIVGFQMNQRDPSCHDYYHLNLDDGKLTTVYQNNGQILDYKVDQSLNVKAILIKNGDCSEIRFIADDENQVVDKFLIEDGFTSHILQFDKEMKHLYYLRYHDKGYLALFQYVIADKKVELIYVDDKYDIDSVVFDQLSGRPIAVGVLGYYNHYKQLEQNYLIKRCNELFKEDYYVLSQSLDNSVYLVKHVQSNGKTIYYTVTNTECNTICEVKPWLQNNDLSAHKPYSVIARDGLKLEGYITYPNCDAKKPLPLVISVHGGPWWRDSVYYMTDETSWLQSLGFIVLNINFRGSTGYGFDFLNAGNKQWGRKMNLDLIDAIIPLIEDGTVDANRVGIFGMSYGGYATLAALAFTPEFFKFGVDRVGPADIKSLLEEIPPHWGPMVNHYYKRIGHPVNEVEFLHSISPLFFADKIQSPLMIVQGLNDQRVKVTESENMVKALEQRGVKVDYMLFEDEGHIITKQKNLYAFYERATEFLTKFI